MDTLNELAALAAAGFISWLVVWGVRREITRREQIEACGSHDRWLDDGVYPTYRCRRCSWQTPARDVVEQREAERIAALVKRCPKCGGELGG